MTPRLRAVQMLHLHCEKHEVTASRLGLLCESDGTITIVEAETCCALLRAALTLAAGGTNLSPVERAARTLDACAVLRAGLITEEHRGTLLR